MRRAWLLAALLPAVSPPRAAELAPRPAAAAPRTSVSVGRELSALIARERLARGHSSWPQYLARLKSDPALTPELRGQVAWAERQPEVFSRLYRGEVLPLDPTYLDGEVVSVVELLQVAAGERDWDHGIWRSRRVREAALGEEVESAVRSPYGPKGLRGSPGFARRVLERRPDLAPFYRPSRAGELLAEGYRLKLSAPAARPRRSGAPPGPRLRAPGRFLGFGIKGLPPAAERDFWRVSWRRLPSAEEAVLHLLGGGERAQSVRPERSLLAQLRELRALPAAELGRLAYRATMSKVYPGKFFLSMSGRRDFPKISEAMGNLRLRVRTQRAFRAPVSLSNLGEDEYGLPLILDPEEVVFAELDYESPAPKRLYFSFEDGGRLVRVRVLGDGPARVLLYRYDPGSKRYRPETSAKQ